MATKQPAGKPAAKKTTKSSAGASAKNGTARASVSPVRQGDPSPANSIFLFCAGLVLLAVTFIPGQSFWYLLHQFLFGMFGTCTYALGPLLLYGAVLLADRSPARSYVLKTIMWMIFICGALVVFSRIDLNELGFLGGVRKLYLSGQEGFLSGGLLGGVFGGTILALCGRPGANIILLVLLVAAWMVSTGRTPGDLWELARTGTDAVQSARTRYQKYRTTRASVAAAAEAEFADEDEEGRQPAAGLDWLRRAQKSRQTAQPGQADQPEPPEQPAQPGPAAPAPEQESFEQFPAEEPVWSAAPQPQPEEASAPAPAAPEAPEAPEAPAPQSRPDVSAAELAALLSRTMEGLEHPAAQARPADPSVADLEKLIQKAMAAQTGAPAAPAPQSPVLPEDTAPIYQFPPVDLLVKSKSSDASGAQEELRHNADLLVRTLDSFGVRTEVLDICRGPTVTRYELKPQAGVKISKITSLADDIALNLSAAGVRIEAPIPGKPAVGIEVPNRIKSPVDIRDILESPVYQNTKSALPLTLGKDIAGAVQVADLCKMPHLLIAGSTGSGKSVCVNSIITGFLYHASPEEVKLILIDPKVVELAEYNGIPHLLMPVVTEPRKAAGALGSAVAEMERRYHMFAENNVRDIKSFNRLAAQNSELEKMPYIAIIIDELADLMMVAGKEVEDYICRIAQKARAAGMHLIVATQRPSVDVITGLIKANIPSRIAFAVSSQVDSRTILDVGGAEKLLGSGDMLFQPVGAPKPVRIQGAFVRDEEITAVLDFIKQGSSAQYDEEMIAEMEKRALPENAAYGSGEEGETHDPMLKQAAETVIDAGMASTSLLQRKCKLGYARAARIMDEMEQMGIIGPYQGAKPREVLISRQQWIERTMNSGEAVPDEI